MKDDFPVICHHRAECVKEGNDYVCDYCYRNLNRRNEFVASFKDRYEPKW